MIPASSLLGAVGVEPVRRGRRGPGRAGDRRARVDGERSVLLPGALLDNMPNFQQGIVYASVCDRNVGPYRPTRGSSEVDPDLDRLLVF